MSEDKIANIVPFAQALCAASDYRSILSTISAELARNLPAENVLVWVYDEAHQHLLCESSRLTTIDSGLLRDSISSETGVHVEVSKTNLVRVLNESDAASTSSLQENIAGLSVILAPLRDRAHEIGVIEAINRQGREFTNSDAAFLAQAASLAAAAINARRDHDRLNTGMLHAVTRLTQLYDVTQSFNTTIDLRELRPIICNRTASVMDVESCSLWLVEGKQMVCREVIGHYRPDVLGHAETDAGTVVGEMLRDNAALTIHDPADPRVASRLSYLDNGGMKSLVCAPVKYEKQWVGALEVINKRDGSAFREADVDLLNEIASQAANSIRNAQRHEAERKVKELQALLNTSREIISSLDLDRVLAVVVNQLATIIPFDRCAIALLDKGAYEIDAVAGEAEVNHKDPKIKELTEIINWASEADGEVYVSQIGEEIDSPRADKFRAHFASTEMRSFYALPLADEEGPLGMLALESKTPRFLTASHLELLKIFAGQAIVAIRNAQLYRQVPLIGALEPLAARKRAFEALPRAKRWLLVGGAVIILLFLLFFPLNLKVGGSAYVLPTRVAAVDAEVDGIIDQINYREGDVVPAGAVVAVLRGEDYLLNLNDARSRYDILSREITRSQAASGAAAAQIEKVKLDQAQREIALYQTKLEQTQIRAPMTGVIVTPRLEEKKGRLIKRGEAFCEQANVNPIVIETAVPEEDIGLVSPGQEVWLKANTFPERKFIGRVLRISPQATVEQGEHVFIVRAEIDNPDQSLRTGMVGRSKILTGSHSIGYVFLRDPARWVRKKIWNWMP